MIGVSLCNYHMTKQAHRKIEKMLENAHNLDLSARDLKLIQDALYTQEKILSVQSRAGGNAAKLRLNEVKELMRRVDVKAPQRESENRKSWIGLTRALFG